MSSELFEQKGAEIFSLKSGKLVATLDEYGEYHLCRGMYSYEPELRKFLSYDPAVSSDADLSPEAAAEAPEPERVQETVRVPLPPDGVEFDEYHFGTGDEKKPLGVMPAPDAPPATSDEQLIRDIPEHRLPYMDPALGVDTPGVREFAKQHKMNSEQFALLVQRIEKRRSI